MSAMDEIQIWPFGKYRGKAVDMVLSDHSYVEWLLHQPWFAEDYAAIYKLITGANSEAQDTPEHNEFQIRFLEEESRLAVAKVLDFHDLDGETVAKKKSIAKRVARELGCVVHEEEIGLRVSGARFEERGWDVAFEIHPASYVAWLDAEHGKDYIELLESWGMAKLAAKNRQLLKEHRGTLDVAVYAPNTSRSPRVTIELKPDLGNDYPSVLRQIQRYALYEEEYGGGGRSKGKAASKKVPDRKLLIARRARFSSVSYEQVKAFFRSADITLLLESELDGFDYVTGELIE